MITARRTQSAAAILLLAVTAGLASPALAQGNEDAWAVTGGLSAPRKQMNRLASEGPIVGAHHYGQAGSVPLRLSLDVARHVMTVSRGQWTQVGLTANALVPLGTPAFYAVGGVGAMYQTAYVDGRGRETGTDPVTTAGLGVAKGRWFADVRYLIVFNERPRTHTLPAVIGFRF